MVGGAGRLVGFGIAAGVGLMLLLQTALRSIVFGVGTFDAASLAGAAGLLAVVSVAAALVPARSAARVDPIEAMRVD
jgi:putative ABC transport system permease protein